MKIISSILTLSAAFNLVTASLSNQEWSLIDPEVPLTDIKNIKALADECVRTRQQTAAKWYHKYQSAEKYARKCQEKSSALLEDEHQSIVASKHPYFDGATQDRPASYYTALVFQYEKDINAEKPLFLAREHRDSCRVLKNLLDVNIVIGLHVNSEWLLDQKQFHTPECVGRILEDARVVINTELATKLVNKIISGSWGINFLPVFQDTRILGLLSAETKKSLVKAVIDRRIGCYGVNAAHADDFFRYLINENLISVNESIPHSVLASKNRLIDYMAYHNHLYFPSRVDKMVDCVIEHPDFDWKYPNLREYASHHYLINRKLAELDYEYQYGTVPVNSDAELAERRQKLKTLLEKSRYNNNNN